MTIYNKYHDYHDNNDVMWQTPLKSCTSIRLTFYQRYYFILPSQLLIIIIKTMFYLKNMLSYNYFIPTNSIC